MLVRLSAGAEELRRAPEFDEWERPARKRRRSFFLVLATGRGRVAVGGGGRGLVRRGSGRHNGLMASEERRRKIREMAARRQRAVVVLEDVFDPHNAAAVIRSCDAFGVQRVCLCFERERPYDPRELVPATSSSANVWLDFETHRSTPACLEELKAEGYTLVATVAGGVAGVESIFDARLDDGRVAIMLGHEKRGLSDAAITLADRRVTIPMRGIVRSLNLSVVAGICLFELTRQREALGMERFLLGEDERTELERRLLDRRGGGA